MTIISSPKSFLQKNKNVKRDHVPDSVKEKPVLEDLKLRPSLAYYYNQYGIEIEEFKVETADGFIIDLWHLISKTTPVAFPHSSERHPILMIHGLLQSSGSFASNGQNSLAYYLFHQGFDVWLGNNRCGFVPSWNPKKVNSRKHWDWDLNEMVKFDLPKLIDTVCKITQNEKISIMAHSQGTTELFMGLLRENELNLNITSNIENVVCLAPALYPGSLLEDSPVLRLLSLGIDSKSLFGKKVFLNVMMMVRKIFLGTSFFSFICYTFFSYLFGWNDTLWDEGLRNRHFLFSPVFVSVKLMQWWLSNDPNKESFIKDYNQFFPQYKKWFHKHQRKNIPNFLLFVPGQDKLVDGKKVIKHFQDFEMDTSYKIWYIKEYSHVDVLWANDIIEKVGKPIVMNLRLPNRRPTTADKLN